VRVYLVRHGHAESAARHPERPLTAEGRQAVEAMAAVLSRGHPLRVAEVRHSVKLRARETAEAIAGTLGLEAPVLEVPGLAPNDDVEAVALELAAEPRDLMLVGHLPFMNDLASRLVCGDASADAFVFTPGTAACLERVPGSERFCVRWVVNPETVCAR
jgi:phosphohistidine phosphatase